MGNQDDAEMLKNLDLLLNMDALQEETDWDDIENLDHAAESTPESEE